MAKNAGKRDGETKRRQSGMNSKQKKAYKKSRAWETVSPFLVNADKGTKVCFHCEANKFTVEFPNVPEFNDYKLPVCLECYRAKDEAARVQVSLFEGVERVCKKCKRHLTLDNYAYRKLTNSLSKTCRNCTGSYY